MSLKRPSGRSGAAAAVVLLGLVWSTGALAAGPNDPRPGVGGEDITRVRPAPASTSSVPTQAAPLPTTGTTTTPVVQAPPGQTPPAQTPPATNSAPPPSGPTDTSSTEDTGTSPQAAASTANPSRPAETLLPYVALGGVILLLGLGVLAYFQLLGRLAQVQRLAASRPEPSPPPVGHDAPGSFMLDAGAAVSSGQNPWNDQSRTPTTAADLARLLGANGGRVEAPTALVSLAGALSELINHALDTDEKLNLVSRAVERHVRAGAATPDNLTRMIDERIEASQGRPVEPDEVGATPVRAAPPVRAAEPPASDELWDFAERLFRRVGLTNVTEEVFQQALANKKAEILADGSYAQRPELLRNNSKAQNIAGVLRLASSEWANRSDEVTIPVGYKAAFADFIESYADPSADFELIWANSGESAKDSAHETSRIDGVRHEVVSGVRWPGLRGGGEVYMRAKVAIA